MERKSPYKHLPCPQEDWATHTKNSESLGRSGHAPPTPVVRDCTSGRKIVDYGKSTYRHLPRRSGSGHPTPTKNSPPRRSGQDAPPTDEVPVGRDCTSGRKIVDYGKSTYNLVLSILFCAITLPVRGELTDADLDKIRLIVKEEVKAEITGVRQELKAEITGVKQELKAEITGVKQELKAEITGSEKRIKDYIDARIEDVDKRFSTYNWVISILMPLIVAAIGIPTAIIAWRSGKDRSHRKAS